MIMVILCSFLARRINYMEAAKTFCFSQASSFTVQKNQELLGAFKQIWYLFEDYNLLVVRHIF